MDLGELTLLTATGALMAFTLGAIVAWRLEGRRPLVPPLWLVVTRNVTFVVWTLYVLVALRAPSGMITIDPFWWTVLKVLPFVAAVVVFPFEVRSVLRRREAS